MSLTEKSVWQRHGGTIVWLGVVGAIIAAGTFGNRSTSTYSSADYTPAYVAPPAQTAPPQAVPSPPPVPVFDEPAVPIGTGEIRYTGPRPRLAPLEIKTPAGTNYYLKLVQARTGQTHLVFYVAGGRTFEVLMPLGEYELKYAVGNTWYGEQHLFGPNTAYARADAAFHFTEEPDGYSGYTVELQMRPGGNLDTESIPASAF